MWVYENTGWIGICFLGAAIFLINHLYYNYFLNLPDDKTATEHGAPKNFLFCKGMYLLTFAIGCAAGVWCTIFTSIFWDKGDPGNNICFIFFSIWFVTLGVSGGWKIFRYLRWYKVNADLVNEHYELRHAREMLPWSIGAFIVGIPILFYLAAPFILAIALLQMLPSMLPSLLSSISSALDTSSPSPSSGSFDSLSSRDESYSRAPSSNNDYQKGRDSYASGGSEPWFGESDAYKAGYKDKKNSDW